MKHIQVRHEMEIKRYKRYKSNIGWDGQMGAKSAASRAMSRIGLWISVGDFSNDSLKNSEDAPESRFLFLYNQSETNKFHILTGPK